MNPNDIESRIVVLEKEISSLKTKFAKIENDEPWWKQRIGLFEDDPSHNEAVCLGRRWRDHERSNDI